MFNLKDVCLQEVFRIYSHGSMGYGDFLVLLQFCQDKNLVVELGTCTGSTTWLLSFMAKDVYTCDIFENLDLIEDVEQRNFYKKNWKQTQHTFEKIKEALSPIININVSQMLSYEYNDSFVNNYIDVLFFDADHSYKGLKREYNNWFSKVKIGGIFLFHDVVNSPELKGVYQFYNKELLKDERIIEEKIDTDCPTSIKAFRRIK